MIRYTLILIAVSIVIIPVGISLIAKSDFFGILFGIVLFLIILNWIIIAIGSGVRIIVFFFIKNKDDNLKGFFKNIVLFVFTGGITLILGFAILAIIIGGLAVILPFLA